ncbi:MAG TPA: hypothetical protein VMY35_19580 [Phycisphaerae bacterium]|nr:hypothetical protein [Phycisphaerae bacterium]
MWQVFMGLLKSRKTQVALIALVVAVMGHLMIELGMDEGAVKDILTKAEYLAYAVIAAIMVEDAAKKLGNGIGGNPAILLCFLLPALVAGGCGGHAFMMDAPIGIANASHEIEVGLDEYHAAAQTELANARTAHVATLKADLALNMMKMQAGELKFADEAAVKAALDGFLKKHTDALDSLGVEVANENERYRRCLSLTDWVRRLTGQLVQIETRRYATVEELKTLAERYVGQQITGADNGTSP